MGCIKIDKKALFHNLDLICSRAGGSHRVAAVLKDNAYGHGLEVIAPLISDFGIKKAVVRNLQEAERIERFFEYILVLADIPKKTSKFSFAINSIESIESFPKGCFVELKVDTGMHRSGISPLEVERAVEKIVKRGLILKGVFTHFRSADEIGPEFFWQKRNFDETIKKVESLRQEFSLPDILYHSYNSSALFRSENLQGDFARVGIAVYGYLELDPLFGEPDLKPVLSLWASRISSRTLKPKERVGYGGVFEAKGGETVSTYDIGYADGIFRSDGKRRLLLPEGVEIAGRISMDSFSALSDAEEICVIKDAREFARFFGTISYEVLVKLSPFLKRRVVQ